MTASLTAVSIRRSRPGKSWLTRQNAISRSFRKSTFRVTCRRRWRLIRNWDVRAVRMKCGACGAFPTTCFVRVTTRPSGSSKAPMLSFSSPRYRLFKYNRSPVSKPERSTSTVLRSISIEQLHRTGRPTSSPNLGKIL